MRTGSQPGWYSYGDLRVLATPLGEDVLTSKEDAIAKAVAKALAEQAQQPQRSR